MLEQPKPPRADPGAEVARNHGLERSAQWPEVERAHLAREGHCVCCPLDAPPEGLQVHHVIPFHYCVALGRPDLELDERNLITLCQREDGKPGEDHHLLVGHLGDFRSSNLDVERDARVTFHAMGESAIRASKIWLAKAAGKLTPLAEMSDVAKKALRVLMDRQMPIDKKKRA